MNNDAAISRGKNIGGLPITMKKILVTKDGILAQFEVVNPTDSMYYLATPLYGPDPKLSDNGGNSFKYRGGLDKDYPDGQHHRGVGIEPRSTADLSLRFSLDGTAYEYVGKSFSLSATFSVQDPLRKVTKKSSVSFEMAQQVTDSPQVESKPIDTVISKEKNIGGLPISMKKILVTKEGIVAQFEVVNPTDSINYVSIPGVDPMLSDENGNVFKYKGGVDKISSVGNYSSGIGIEPRSTADLSLRFTLGDTAYDNVGKLFSLSATFTVQDPRKKSSKKSSVSFELSK